MPPMARRLTVTLRILAIVAGALVVLLAVTLALPIEAWRRGEPDMPRLAVSPGQPFSPRPLRVWIDTDAACGQGRRTDPDDCLAILLLARSPEVEIAGVSTVAGNAPLAVTDSTTRALVAELAADGARLPDVVRGTAGQAAMQRALAAGPLTVIALGPLTNVAAALQGRPDLQPQVTLLVAVMGRRRGHLFHPVEGGTAGSLFGHGPVFTDFNVRQDVGATALVLEMGLPWTLVPYEAAREVMITGDDLERIATAGGAAAWVARHARAWHDYWQDDIGRQGFYPFDLLAAAYGVRPELLHCAEVTAWVGEDMGLLGLLGRRGLFVDRRGTRPEEASAIGLALYCPEAAAELDAWLVSRLADATAGTSRLEQRAVRYNPHCERRLTARVRGARGLSLHLGRPGGACRTRVLRDAPSSCDTRGCAVPVSSSQDREDTFRERSHHDPSADHRRALHGHRACGTRLGGRRSRRREGG